MLVACQTRQKCQGSVFSVGDETVETVTEIGVL